MYLSGVWVIGSPPVLGIGHYADSTSVLPSMKLTQEETDLIIEKRKQDTMNYVTKHGVLKHDLFLNDYTVMFNVNWMEGEDFSTEEDIPNMVARFEKQIRDWKIPAGTKFISVLNLHSMKEIWVDDGNDKEYHLEFKPRHIEKHLDIK